MTAYATAADLASYLAGSSVQAPEDDADVDALLTDASADVDRLIGAFPKLDTGLVLDPTLLTWAQQQALIRATCAACEYRLEEDDDLIGATGYLSGPLTMSWRGTRPPGPKVGEALAGYGLVRRSGCAAPTPDPEMTWLDPS